MLSKRNINAILFSFLLSGICITALGQPSNPVNPTPIDGGIGLLIAAGVAYGAKKAHDKHKGT
ncbi:MAG: PID-CTERM protein-sorting domain-containing protein [Owenweeksia sp.]